MSVPTVSEVNTNLLNGQVSDVGPSQETPSGLMIFVKAMNQSSAATAAFAEKFPSQMAHYNNVLLTAGSTMTLRYQ